ncbi:MAG: hypothetical protein WDM70_07475 [Nitrosomonadales bacterium]
MQAEEILKDALNNNPENQQVRLKLLSIYTNRKDIKAFDAVAHPVKDKGNAKTWAQVAAMGRQLEPNNPIYASDVGAVAEQATAPKDQTDTGQHPANLDFDLDFGATAAPSAALDIPLEAATEVSSGLDFDLGSGTEAVATQIVAEPELPKEIDISHNDESDTTSILDFDLGLETPVEAEAQPPAAMDFERTMVLNAPPKQEGTVT